MQKPRQKAKATARDPRRSGAPAQPRIVLLTTYHQPYPSYPIPPTATHRTPGTLATAHPPQRSSIALVAIAHSAPLDSRCYSAYPPSAEAAQQLSHPRGTRRSASLLLPATWADLRTGRTMLLSTKGMTWKSAKARLPPSRAIWTFLTRTRFLLFVALAGIVVLIWNGVRGTAGDWQR